MKGNASRELAAGASLAGSSRIADPQSANRRLALCECTIGVAKIADPQIENRRLALRKPTANSIVISYYAKRNRLLHVM